MAIGKAKISMAIGTKEFNKQMSRVQNQFKKTANSFKNIFVAAKIGSYLFAGANKHIEEHMAKVRQKVNFKELGFDEKAANSVFEISDSFEKLGYSAETANDAFTQFISTGKGTALRSIGIVLDKNKQATLSAATAQERLNWVMAESPAYLQGMKDELPDHIKNMVGFKKSSEDLQKSLGSAFLGTINNIVSAFGGLENAMKAALVAFTVYKMAMIVGNVAIGISKAIAQGGVFGAPIAIGMGAAALAALLAMGVGVGIAFNSIGGSSMENAPGANGKIAPPPPPIVSVEINEDRFDRSVNQKSGGQSSSIQSNYAGSK